MDCALNRTRHGISIPPCGRSAEYLRLPDTVHLITPPRFKNSEQTRDTFLGKCPMITSFFFTATAYQSWEFRDSLTQFNVSPRAAFHTVIRVRYSEDNTTDTQQDVDNIDNLNFPITTNSNLLRWY